MSEADKMWLILKDLFVEGAPEDLILNGAFDELFKESLVRFNKKDGTFTFRNEYKSSLNIRGEGFARLWTEKALNRAGYSVTSKETDTLIEIISDQNGNRWIVENKKVRMEFRSVYDLISWVCENLA